MTSNHKVMSIINSSKYATCLLLALTLSSCPSGVSGKPVSAPSSTGTSVAPRSPIVTPLPPVKSPSLSAPNSTPIAQLAYPWTSFLGSHSTTGVPESWAGSLRSVGLNSTGKVTSYNAPYNQTINNLISTQQKSVIVQVGGLQSSKRLNEALAFLNGVKKDGGKQWKDIVYKQALTLAKMPNGPDKVYWQIGNEINSKDHSLAFRTFFNEGSNSKTFPNDEFVIAGHVEYYLAPTVEALRKASRDSLASDNRIRIALGSVANAGNPSSVDWMNKLLAYRIRGDFAPSLAGKQVKDLVNIITIHYLVTSDDTSWREVLTQLSNTWIGQGQIAGIWLTEEIGKLRAYAGRGGATALKVTARYLDWALGRSITPTQGRVFMWGSGLGNPGTTGDEAMQTLFNFLGNTPLSKYGQPIGLTSPDLEAYGFQSNTDPNKKVIFVFPKIGAKPERLEKKNLTEREKAREDARKRRPRNQASFEAIPSPLLQQVSITSASNAKVSATMNLFSSSGRSTVPVSVTSLGNSHRLSLGKGITLSNQAVAVFFVTTSSK
ncbi:MAG TPA: hypothetical protein V6D19_10745 [Stenomitos sp.]